MADIYNIMIEAASFLFLAMPAAAAEILQQAQKKVDTKGPGEPRAVPRRSYLYLIIITEYRQRVDGSWSRKHRNYKHQPIHCGHPGALFITKVTAPRRPPPPSYFIYISRWPKNELGTKIIMWITHNSRPVITNITPFPLSLATNNGGHYCSFFTALMLFFGPDEII